MGIKFLLREGSGPSRAPRGGACWNQRLVFPKKHGKHVTLLGSRAESLLVFQLHRAGLTCGGFSLFC